MAELIPTNLKVGSVLERSFAIYRRNFAAFSLISLLLLSPSMIFGILTLLGEIKLDDKAADFVSWLLELTLSNLAVAAIVYGTFQELREQRPSFNDCISHGLALVFPAIGISFVSSLASSIGMLFLIAPGVFIMTILWVAIPAAVSERLGVVQAMKRSAELTAGNRWRVLGIVLILGLINFVPVMLVTVVLLTGGAEFSESLFWILAIAMLIRVFTAAFGAVLSSVTYHDLRVIKEGASIEEVARIFN